ncbi:MULTISPECIES: hypothetical protein [Pseudomonadati]
MKKYISRRRKRAPRRKRSFKSKAAKIGKSIQKSSYSYVKKKYTAVIPMQLPAGRDRFQATISHVGGKNATNAAGTITLTSCDPDGMATRDMASYQYFKITGVGMKLFFPEGTTPAATPC